MSNGANLIQVETDSSIKGKVYHILYDQYTASQGYSIAK